MKRPSSSSLLKSRLPSGSLKPDSSPSLPSPKDKELEKLPMPAWSASRDGREICFNEYSRRLLKLKRNVGPIEDLLESHIHPEDRSEWSKVWRKFINGASQSLEHLVRWQFPGESGKPPTETWLAIRAQRVGRKATSILGWLRTAEAERALCRLENLIRG